MRKDLKDAVAGAKAANELNPLLPDLIFNSIETNLRDDERVIKIFAAKAGISAFEHLGKARDSYAKKKWVYCDYR